MRELAGELLLRQTNVHCLLFFLKIPRGPFFNSLDGWYPTPYRSITPIWPWSYLPELAGYYFKHKMEKLVIGILIWTVYNNGIS